MEESTSKEKILKKIRNALINQGENPYGNIDLDSDIYTPPDDSPDIMFAKAFAEQEGKFIYCSDASEFKENIRLLFRNNHWDEIFCLDAGILDLLKGSGIRAESSEARLYEPLVSATRCEYLIARTGSIMVSSAHPSGRKLNIIPEIHIVIAFTSQLVYDIRTAIHNMKQKYKHQLPSLISLISGPSRTDDIERKTVIGMHGPKEVYLFLIEDGTEVI